MPAFWGVGHSAILPDKAEKKSIGNLLHQIQLTIKFIINTFIAPSVSNTLQSQLWQPKIELFHTILTNMACYLVLLLLE